MRTHISHRTTKRILIAVVMTLAFYGAGQFGASAQALASTGDYPYANKPCVRSPYKTEGTKPHWCAYFEWGDKPGNTTAANVISPYGYYYRNCTDYIAWKLNTLGVQPAQYKGLGNAKKWATPPVKNGLRVDRTPAVGSVAVYTAGTYGHIAYVEELLSDGRIRVSQYNKQGDGNYSQAIGLPARLGFTMFVHFETYQTPPRAIAPVVVESEPAAAPPVEATVPSVTLPEPVAEVAKPVVHEETPVESLPAKAEPANEPLATTPPEPTPPEEPAPQPEPVAEPQTDEPVDIPVAIGPTPTPVPVATQADEELATPVELAPSTTVFVPWVWQDAPQSSELVDAPTPTTDELRAQATPEVPTAILKDWTSLVWQQVRRATQEAITEEE